jgi:hypothetical protein
MGYTQQYTYLLQTALPPIHEKNGVGFLLGLLPGNLTVWYGKPMNLTILNT